MKKTRAPTKNKQAVPRAPENAPLESNQVENTDDKVSAPKERKACPHLEKGFDLDKFSAKLWSSDSIGCEDCREGVSDRKGKKGKGKQGKKKGSDAKSDSKAIWVCLNCGHYACGGVGLPTTPQSHVVRHARQARHSLVIQWENPYLRWCFPCNTLIQVEKAEEDGENKDSILEVVRLIKNRTQEGQPADVEDVWFGGGTVMSEVKSEGLSNLSGLSGKGGYMVRGMSNLGNTCFFNSIMQNLLAISTLRDYFLNLDASFGSLTISLKKLYSETNPDSGLRNVINPKSFFGCLCSKAPQFRGYQQHDSHEVLRCLLDGLCTEESGFRKRQIASEENGISSDQGPPFVDSVFGGKISSTVSCLECGHSSTVYEPFLDLSLPVPTKKPPPKKAQPSSRAKKTKLPPKKNVKSRTKVTRASGTAPAQRNSNPSTSTESTAQKMLSSGDSSISSAVDPIIVVATSDPASQNSPVDPCSANVPDLQKSEDQKVASPDDFMWLDYVGPENLSDEHDLTLDYNEIMFIQESGDKDKISGDNVIESNQIPLPNDESNNKPDSSEGNPCEDEVPLVVQESEVILLPYDEENSTTLEIMNNGAEASSSVMDCGEEDLGFGDLFNEPEVYGPVARPYSSNGRQESGSVLGNSSESDPDEVDDSDSPVSVESCLAHFIKPELLTDDNAWHCENCSKTLQCQKLEAKKKLAKLVVNGEKAQNQNDVQNTKEFQCSKDTTSNGDVNYDIDRDTSCKNVVSCNSKSDRLNQSCGEVDGAQTFEMNQDGTQLKEEKVETNDSAEKSVALGVQESSSQGSIADQAEDSCRMNESRDAECSTNKVEESDSGSSARNVEPVKVKDEEVNSKTVKVKRDATKRVLINKAPPILTIHLKRFSQDLRGRLSKLNGHVIFRETIDLRPYMDPRYPYRTFWINIDVYVINAIYVFSYWSLDVLLLSADYRKILRLHLYLISLLHFHDVVT